MLAQAGGRHLFSSWLSVWKVLNPRSSAYAQPCRQFTVWDNLWISRMLSPSSLEMKNSGPMTSSCRKTFRNYAAILRHLRHGAVFNRLNCCEIVSKWVDPTSGSRGSCTPLRATPGKRT